MLQSFKELVEKKIFEQNHCRKIIKNVETDGGKEPERYYTHKWRFSAVPVSVALEQRKKPTTTLLLEYVIYSQINLLFILCETR